MAVVITPDGRRAIHRRGFPFAPSSGTSYDGGQLPVSVPLVNGQRSSYLRIYRSQPWVYIGVNKLAKSVANLPLNTYVQRRNGDREKVRPGLTSQGRLAALLERPAPHLSAYDLKFDLVTSLYIHGHWLAVKTVGDETISTGGALPSELWPVPWENVEIIEGKRRPIDAFVITVDGRRYPFTPEEVVHLQHWGGISPLEPLRRTLAIEDATLRETTASFENGVRTSGIFTASTPRLNKNDADAIRTELEATYGGVDRAYKVAVVGGGLDWKPVQFSHQEAELIPVRKLAREEVAAALDIPPPMIGILDHATYSNFDQAHRSFYMESVAPILIKSEEGLESQLLYPEPEWRGLDLEFDMGEVMKSDLASRAEAYTKLTRVGFSLNQILHMENQPEIDEPLYQTAWIPQELMPASSEAMDAWMTAQRDSKQPNAAPAGNSEEATALMAAAMAAISREPQQLSLPNIEVNSPPVTVYNKDVTDEVRSVVEGLTPPQITVDTAPFAAVSNELEQRAEQRHRELLESNAKLAALVEAAGKPKRKRVERDADGLIAEVIEFPVEETG